MKHVILLTLLFATYSIFAKILPYTTIKHSTPQVSPHLKKQVAVSKKKHLRASPHPTTKTPTLPKVEITNQTITTNNTTQPDPHVLQLALNAYQCATLEGQNKQNLLTIVDYSKPSTQKRLWILDVPHNKLLFNSLVAHGKGSGKLLPSYFSDQPKTHASSLGLFLTGNPYQGHNGYSLRLYGLEKNFNENALSRDIVVHGANYVSDSLARTGRIGRSWGCPAVPRELAQPIIDTIKGGSMVFAYYPDARWLNQSPYLHCSAGSLNSKNVAMLPSF